MLLSQWINRNCKRCLQLLSHVVCIVSIILCIKAYSIKVEHRAPSIENKHYNKFISQFFNKFQDLSHPRWLHVNVSERESFVKFFCSFFQNFKIFFLDSERSLLNRLWAILIDNKTPFFLIKSLCLSCGTFEISESKTEPSGNRESSRLRAIR